MSINDVSIVVVGGLGADITGYDFDRLAGAGELSYGGKLNVNAGGKSRNIAHMISMLTGPGKVAMVGRTSKDPLNLWRVPIDSLTRAGVNIEFIKQFSFEESGKYPTVALIAVDKNGKNQIYVLPGINEEFPVEEINQARPLFEAATKNNGMLVLTLEMPYAACLAAVKLANSSSLKVLLDPGGISHNQNVAELLDQPLYLIKPNEHEARQLTGVTVTDLASAKKAALHLFERKTQNVLITLGSAGAYLVYKNADQVIATHIPVPAYKGGEQRDETGCGDQTMAALCAGIHSGLDLKDACRQAILAGTIQFYKVGIAPVSKDELCKATVAR